MKIRKVTLMLTFVWIFSFVLAGCGRDDAPADASSEAGGRKNDTEALREEETSADGNKEPSEEKDTEASRGGEEPPADGNKEPSEEKEIAKMETEDMLKEHGGILVAYFSHTGTTKEVAQMIAEYTGGDLAEIKRAEEYGDLQEEAEVEIQDGIHPEITVSVSNVADYSTVFVGYAGGIIGLN